MNAEGSRLPSADFWRLRGRPRIEWKKTWPKECEWRMDMESNECQCYDVTLITTKGTRRLWGSDVCEASWTCESEGVGFVMRGWWGSGTWSLEKEVRNERRKKDTMTEETIYQTWLEIRMSERNIYRNVFVLMPLVTFEDIYIKVFKRWRSYLQTCEEV